MTRVLVVEPGYCPYQAGFASAAEAVAQVVEGNHQILKPFGTPKIGLICSCEQSRLKYNRQINDDGLTIRGRFLICGLNGDKIVGLSKEQADRYSRLLFGRIRRRAHPLYRCGSHPSAGWGCANFPAESKVGGFCAKDQRHQCGWVRQGGVLRQFAISCRVD